MSSNMVPEVIMLLAGIVVTLLGYRVIGPHRKTNVILTPAQLKAEKLYRFVGPFVFLCGLFGLALTTLRNQ